MEWNGLTILVEGHPGNLPVKLFQNPSSHFGGEVVKSKKLTTHGRRTKTDHNSSP